MTDVCHYCGLPRPEGVYHETEEDCLRAVMAGGEAAVLHLIRQRREALARQAELAVALRRVGSLLDR